MEAKEGKLLNNSDYSDTDFDMYLLNKSINEKNFLTQSEHGEDNQFSPEKPKPNNANINSTMATKPSTSSAQEEPHGFPKEFIFSSFPEGFAIKSQNNQISAGKEQDEGTIVEEENEENMNTERSGENEYSDVSISKMSQEGDYVSRASVEIGMKPSQAQRRDEDFLKSSVQNLVRPDSEQGYFSNGYGSLPLKRPSVPGSSNQTSNVATPSQSILKEPSLQAEKPVSNTRPQQDSKGQIAKYPSPSKLDAEEFDFFVRRPQDTQQSKQELATDSKYVLQRESQVKQKPEEQKQDEDEDNQEMTEENQFMKYFLEGEGADDKKEAERKLELAARSQHDSDEDDESHDEDLKQNNMKMMKFNSKLSFNMEAQSNQGNPHSFRGDRNEYESINQNHVNVSSNPTPVLGLKREDLSTQRLLEASAISNASFGRRLEESDEEEPINNSKYDMLRKQGKNLFEDIQHTQNQQVEPPKVQKSRDRDLLQDVKPISKPVPQQKPHQKKQESQNSSEAEYISIDVDEISDASISYNQHHLAKLQQRNMPEQAHPNRKNEQAFLKKADPVGLAPTPSDSNSPDSSELGARRAVKTSVPNSQKQGKVTPIRMSQQMVDLKMLVDKVEQSEVSMQQDELLLKFERQNSKNSGNISGIAYHKASSSSQSEKQSSATNPFYVKSPANHSLSIESSKHFGLICR